MRVVAREGVCSVLPTPPSACLNIETKGMYRKGGRNPAKEAMLRHACSRTGGIYTHVTETSIRNNQSPFDDLKKCRNIGIKTIESSSRK